MSGMFGGRPQTESSNSTSTSAPVLPEYLKPYMTEAASQAQDLYKSGALSPAYYSGSTVAGPSSDTQDYYSAVRSIANGGQPSALQQAAVAQQLGTINGNQLYAESNPYLKSAMNAANSSTIEQFRDSTAPTLMGTFSGAGRLSSGASGNAYAKAAGQLSDSLANSNATMAYNNYNDAANRQQAASQYAPTLAAGDYANANQLATVGALQDNYQQNVIDADVDRYNYNANLPQLSLQNYINLLNGTAGSVGTGSSSVATSAKYGDQTRTQSTLMQGAQLAALLSDVRLKINIDKIGKMKNGLSIYAFDYVFGGARTVGVMAQDVAKIKPEAVMVHPSGYLMVDYGAL